jgi:hypothetical protein
MKDLKLSEVYRLTTTESIYDGPWSVRDYAPGTGAVDMTREIDSEELYVAPSLASLLRWAFLAYDELGIRPSDLNVHELYFLPDSLQLVGIDHEAIGAYNNVVRDDVKMFDQFMVAKGVEFVLIKDENSYDTPIDERRYRLVATCSSYEQAMTMAEQDTFKGTCVAYCQNGKTYFGGSSVEVYTW